MRRSFAAVVGFVLTLACPIAAANAAWTIARSSGTVWIGSDGVQKTSLPPNGVLPEGATVTTGSNGRVLLTRNKEVMTIGPKTIVTIPADSLFGFTTVIQQAGQVEFDVEKRNVRHFSVRTPYLAAVVKGTHFTVQINGKGASVSVERGLVGVTNASDGQSLDVAPGQTASVPAEPGPTVLTGLPEGPRHKDGDAGKRASNNTGSNPAANASSESRNILASAENGNGAWSGIGNGNNGSGGANTGSSGNGSGGSSGGSGGSSGSGGSNSGSGSSGSSGGSGGSSGSGGGNSGSGGGNSGSSGNGGSGSSGDGQGLIETVLGILGQ
jgi:uncharacterized membrane protein YgcG